MALLLGNALYGCSSSSDPEVDQEVLFQVSTLDALLNGRFDGLLPFGDLKKHGDFGLGTFDALNGEMIFLDHEVYQVRVDGRAYPVADAMKTPFAAVTFFEAEQTAVLEASLDCAGLEAAIDSLLPPQDIAYAVKVSGQFASLTTRSVAPQTRPYPGLADALRGQVEFALDDVEGTLVGFRLPAYMDGANVAGYHFHFLTEDRSAGGHVLACQTRRVQVEVDDTGAWYVALP